MAHLSVNSRPPVVGRRSMGSGPTMMTATHRATLENQPWTCVSPSNSQEVVMLTILHAAAQDIQTCNSSMKLGATRVPLPPSVSLEAAEDVRTAGSSSSLRIRRLKSFASHSILRRPSSRIPSAPLASFASRSYVPCENSGSKTSQPSLLSVIYNRFSMLADGIPPNLTHTSCVLSWRVAHSSHE